MCTYICVGAAPPKTETIPDRVGGFPVDFLRQVVSTDIIYYILVIWIILSCIIVQMQLSKLLSLKQQITSKLSHMNTEAEKAVSYAYYIV